MPNLNIKNVPKELYARIKKRATEHRRSLNSEVLVTLETALNSRRVDSRRFLTQLDKLHAGIKHPPLTDTLLKTARRKGRP